ncbi:MAG: transposase, partial [Planctomycetota bacterium]
MPSSRRRRVRAVFLRRLALPAGVRHWTLTTLRDRLIQVGAKVVRHARYVTFQLAEVAVPRRLYRARMQRIQRFAETPIRGAPARASVRDRIRTLDTGAGLSIGADLDPHGLTAPLAPETTQEGACPATFRLICALRRSDHAGGASHWLRKCRATERGGGHKGRCPLKCL